MKRHLVFLIALLALCGASRANAAIHVTIGDASVLPGATTTIDLFLEADEATNLAGFGFELSIDMPYGNASLLEFVEPRLAYEDDPAYVFFDATSGPSGDTAGISPATRWIGFDLADDTLLRYVELNPNEAYLLARLELRHSSLAPPFDPSGHEFPVSLIDGANTYFLDDGFDEINGITSTPGTVTVLQSPELAEIPEPSSLLIFASLALCAAPYLRCRSRQTQ